MKLKKDGGYFNFVHFWALWIISSPFLVHFFWEITFYSQCEKIFLKALEISRPTHPRPFTSPARLLYQWIKLRPCEEESYQSEGTWQLQYDWKQCFIRKLIIFVNIEWNIYMYDWVVWWQELNEYERVYISHLIIFSSSHEPEVKYCFWIFVIAAEPYWQQGNPSPTFSRRILAFYVYDGFEVGKDGKFSFLYT